MNSKTLLKNLAQSHLHHGPHKRRQDAETLLSMLDVLDNEGARIYMERFINKWQLLDQNQPPQATFIRRRPMSQMEQQVTQHLIDGDTKEDPEVLIEWESPIAS